jgi:hypothetical protein
MRTLTLLLSVMFSSLSWADGCDLLPPPAVTVKPMEERLIVDTHYSIKELTFLGSGAARAGNPVLGLTIGKAIAKFSSALPLYVDRSGRWECASPQLTLTLGFGPMTIYVAKEFPAGSCAYDEIYRHEQRHVKAYQEHLAAIGKTLSDSLSRRFAGGGPWHGPVNGLRERLQGELSERWLPYIEREIAQVDDAQALIDTPEEYARVSESCNGEIKKQLSR